MTWNVDGFSMKILAGTHRGRPLRTLPGEATRPTSALVRGALFDILGPTIPEGAFLDLFAGSGAVALEALSRGAPRAVAIEEAAAALAVIRENASRLSLGDRLELVAAEVLKAIPRLSGPFAAIFADPPYGPELGVATLAAIAARPDLLAAQASVLLEHRRRDPAPPAAGFLVRMRQYGYGDTVLSLYRASGG